MQGRIPELVVGVRNRSAFTAGKDYADAVYFSVDRFSLRARAKEITLDNLEEFVGYIKECSLKSYLVINTVIYPEDLPAVNTILDAANNAQVDAVIAWDPAVIQAALDRGIRVHISTQANVSNWQAAEFYRKLGASRVVLSRELSLKQIKDIRQHTSIELEVFVHGAMCQAISGRCYLSAYLLGKSANCGECNQPCRWQWTLNGEDGVQVELGGKYLLSSKDLCMIEHIPELIETGVDAFKIEGRLRNTSYTSTVSRCYRQALEAYENSSYTILKAREWKQELNDVYNRGFSTGFYFGVPGPDGQAIEADMNASSVQRQAVGVVLNYYSKQGAAAVRLLEQGLALGDVIVIEGTNTYVEQKVESLQIGEKSVRKALKGDEVGLGVTGRVRKNDRVYRVKNC
ncbi:MAG TPA: U32 family peptidase [Candidatus Nanoarchaeia archaeon]|nr:U32 family peptidase [Candidatus Nanoarchaeia archaeon]